MTTTVASRAHPSLSRRSARSRTSEIRDLLAVIERPGMLSLAGGLPAPDALPVERIRCAMDRVLDRQGPTGALALQYGPTEGIEELRDLVAPGTAGSPPLGPAARVLVTTGSQQALELVVRALVDTGDRVVVEDPLYLGTRQVLDAHGARLAPVPVDAHGLDTARLESALRAGLRPKIVVVVPNCSNPSGTTLPPERRVHLAHLATRYGFLVVEDDAYHGLVAGGSPPEPIGHHAPDHTVTIGTASKMVAPGLRVGFLGAPGWLRPTLVRLKQAMDLHTPTIGQLVVAELVGDPDFLAAHLATVRARYEGQASTLRTALAGVVATPAPTGGMFLWGTAHADTRAAFTAAVAAGVAYVPGDAFTVTTDGRHALRLSFATLPPEQLQEAASRLRAVLTRPS